MSHIFHKKKPLSQKSDLWIPEKFVNRSCLENGVVFQNKFQKANQSLKTLLSLASQCHSVDGIK